jgi:SCY1-like protein 1
LQPTAEGQESATDYDDDWDNEDWGSIEGDNEGQSKSNSHNLDANKDGSSSGSSPSANNFKYASSRPAETDGWDNWAIDETEEKDGWNDGEFVPESRPDIKSTSSIDWESGQNKLNAQSNQEDFFSSVTTSLRSAKLHHQASRNDWNTDDWGSSTASVPDPEKQEEMRKRREERKLQRQKELEAKKSSKPGPMKLGAKKV